MAPFARDLNYEGPPFTWSEDRRALLRAELDAWYARAYGLTRDELRYVLDPADVKGSDYPSETFRVLKDKEIALATQVNLQRAAADFAANDFLEFAFEEVVGLSGPERDLEIAVVDRAHLDRSRQPLVLESGVPESRHAE
jgi:hypothetical protein